MPPFDVLRLPFTPFYCCIKKKKTLYKFNKCQALFSYMFPFMMFAGVFILSNIALLPFAYLYSLVHKFLIMVRKCSGSNVYDFFLFFFFGVVILLLAQFRDLYDFTRKCFFMNPGQITDMNEDND